MENKGDHVLADIYLTRDYSDRELIDLCKQAIEISNMTIEKQVIKQFTPTGLTAVWILSESHFTIHTYPEHKYISVDCYTCGEEGDPSAAVFYLTQNLSIKESTVKKFIRGGAI